MDLGMPTLIETANIEECVALCKELQLDFIELNMNLPQYQIETINVQQFKEICEREKIYLTIHLDENFNVCDFNNEITNAYTRTILSTIEIAKQLKVPVLNMHMAEGVYFTLPDRKVFLFEQYKEIYLGKLRKFKDLCEKAIGNSGIQICIENCSGYMEFMKEGIELLLGSNVFALTLDIGHDHSAKGADEIFINQHIDRLYHMHVHDAKGSQNHLPLGMGEIDLNKKFALARERNSRVVLETKTIEGLKQSVKKLPSYL